MVPVEDGRRERRTGEERHAEVPYRPGTLTAARAHQACQQAKATQHHLFQVRLSKLTKCIYRKK
jgi:hypothetical protein